MAITDKDGQVARDALERIFASVSKHEQAKLSKDKSIVALAIEAAVRSEQ